MGNSTKQKMSLARNRYTYAFWAINGYIAHCTSEKAFGRRLIFGLRSIVPTNGSNGQGTPTIILATQLPCHLLLAPIVPING